MWNWWTCSCHLYNSENGVLLICLFVLLWITLIYWIYIDILIFISACDLALIFNNHGGFRCFWYKLKWSWIIFCCLCSPFHKAFTSGDFPGCWLLWCSRRSRFIRKWLFQLWSNFSAEMFIVLWWRRRVLKVINVRVVPIMCRRVYQRARSE